MLCSQVDKVVKVFRAVAKYPTPSSARIMNGVAGSNGITVLSSWSQRNLEQGASVKFQRTHIVDLKEKASHVLPVDTTSEYVHLHSVAVILRGWSGAEKVPNERIRGSIHSLPLVMCRHRLYGLVVRVSGYRSRGPGFNFQRYLIF
jgi:hypothetical protein